MLACYGVLEADIHDVDERIVHLFFRFFKAAALFKLLKYRRVILLDSKHITLNK